MDTIKVSIDPRFEDLVIIHPLKIGDTPEESVAMSEAIIAEVLRIYADHPDKKFNVLADLRDQQKPLDFMPDPSVRNYDRIIKNKQTKRVAVLGISKFQSFVINMILNRNQQEVNWFTDEEEAMLSLGYQPTDLND